jgi:hypothetical protein
MSNAIFRFLIGGYMELLWAAIGSALSLIFYVLYEFVGQLRIPVDLFHVWHSTWQPTVALGWEWVTEELEIRRTICGIRMINRNNSRDFKWQGKARLIDNTYLIGEWKSLKPGANTEGVFSLTFSTEGNCLLGFFMSRDLDREKIASCFALGRTLDDMKEGRKKLESRQIKFPNLESTDAD